MTRAGSFGIALIHADGKLPNLALMRLGTYFRARGEAVRLVRAGQRRESLFDARPQCYGSSIFLFSAKARAAIEREWGEVQWGGTGVRLESDLAEVDPGVEWEAVAPDYGLYPDFAPSIGFTQRGCRLSCKFCVVPRKEGKPRAVHSVAEIWRGEPHPRKLILLDNDFFGQPQESWRARIEEIRAGAFRVALSQGINIRQVDEESAAALASIEYRDNEFRSRILYTAWDNLGEETTFKRGVERLRIAGIPPQHLRVYMLVGFAKGETFEAMLYRFKELVALGCEPYPMPYDQTRRDLKRFQRWAVTGLYRAIPWEQYDPHWQARQSAATSGQAEIFPESEQGSAEGRPAVALEG
jgi:hypothetical protein